MLRHPAHTIEFPELLDRIKLAKEKRFIYEKKCPSGLSLYVYSPNCVFDKAWDIETLSARGLIVDHSEKRIVATPFPKFFNVQEVNHVIPDTRFYTTEKLDGSLIIIFHHDGQWRTATKGAFDSPQALWAKEQLKSLNVSGLTPGVTYLAEATYPENRIVVEYSESALHMLAAYDQHGFELAWDEVTEASRALGSKRVNRLEFSCIKELLGLALTIPKDQEGYVLRFENGLRLKIKGEAYKRIHALISGINPLNIWAMMFEKVSLPETKKHIPEEFWDDFDAIVALIEKRFSNLTDKITAETQKFSHLTDKELGLNSGDLDPEVKSFVFACRNSKGNFQSGRLRDSIFRSIRPTGNILEGYVPSRKLEKIIAELG